MSPTLSPRAVKSRPVSPPKASRPAHAREQHPVLEERCFPHIVQSVISFADPSALIKLELATRHNANLNREVKTRQLRHVWLISDRYADADEEDAPVDEEDAAVDEEDADSVGTISFTVVEDYLDCHLEFSIEDRPSTTYAGSMYSPYEDETDSDEDEDEEDGLDDDEWDAHERDVFETGADNTEANLVLFQSGRRFLTQVPEFPIMARTLMDPLRGVEVIDMRTDEYDLEAADGLYDRLKNVRTVRHHTQVRLLVDSEMVEGMAAALQRWPEAINVFFVNFAQQQTVASFPWPLETAVTTARRLVFSIGWKQLHIPHGLPFHPAWQLVPPPNSHVVIIFTNDGCYIHENPCDCAKRNPVPLLDRSPNPTLALSYYHWLSPNELNHGSNLVEQIAKMLMRSVDLFVTVVNPEYQFKLPVSELSLRLLVGEAVRDMGHPAKDIVRLMMYVRVLSETDYIERVGWHQFQLETVKDQMSIDW